MTLLVVCSSLDLRAPFSATPAWWQLLEGLCEVGTDLLVTTDHGDAPETPWWRTRPNPLRTVGEAGPYRLVRALAHRVAAPTWTRYLSSLLARHDDVEAVLLLSVPPNHVRGLATALRHRFGRPGVFFDGDAPASLPTCDGLATGFRIDGGADLGEFDGVVSNSEGAVPALVELGVRGVRTAMQAARVGRPSSR